MSVSAPDPDVVAAADAKACRDRLANIKAARAALDKAVNDLRLGREALEAFEDADRLRREAETALAAARADARGIIEQATAEAGGILSDIHAKRLAIAADIRAMIARAKAEKELSNVEV